MPDGLSQAVASAGPTAASSGGAQAVDVARDAFIASFNEILLIAGVLTLAGAALGLLLTRDKDLVTYEASAAAVGDAEEPAPA